MKNSISERRKARYEKFRKKSSLNLVSLMDIFTILVFFLLVNSSNSQQLPNSKNIKLPTSVATKSPKETIVIAVTTTDILVEGRQVAAVNKVLGNSDSSLLIQGLKTELDFQYAKSSRILKGQPKTGLSVTIMGDETIPYELLRKILSTCRQANFTQIAFAAMQKAKDSES
ncbi:hypothetical protein MNBD_GAMMA23-2133 [hydrothermal vent metagenome]|uniref:Sigma-70 factor n=1 Tax=hydrothermal vent metagenome TaxID=652676 RepID=A0A3B0ZUJ7_9ZZZZ